MKKLIILTISIIFILINCTKIDIDDVSITELKFTQDTNYYWIDFSFRVNNTSSIDIIGGTLWFDADTLNNNTYNSYVYIDNIGPGESKMVTYGEIDVKNEPVSTVRFNQNKSTVY